MFCYCLLGGDTAAPSGLYAKLCHAFLVYFLFISIIFKLFYFPFTLKNYDEYISLSVCSHNCQCRFSLEFLCMLSMAMARSFSDGVAIF